MSQIGTNYHNSSSATDQARFFTTFPNGGLVFGIGMVKSVVGAVVDYGVTMHLYSL